MKFIDKNFPNTLNVFEDTLWIIKKISSVVETLVQLYFVAYYVYRIVAAKGFLHANILFLALASTVLVYSLATLREFSTKERKRTRKKVKRWLSIGKIAVNSVVVAFAVRDLVVSTTFSNIDILLTLLSVCGLFLSILSQIVKAIIEYRINLFRYAVTADFDLFLHREWVQSVIDNKWVQSLALKKKGVDLANIDLSIDEDHQHALAVIAKRSKGRRIRRAAFKENLLKGKRELALEAESVTKATAADAERSSTASSVAEAQKTASADEVQSTIDVGVPESGTDAVQTAAAIANAFDDEKPGRAQRLKGKVLSVVDAVKPIVSKRKRKDDAEE